MRYDRARFLTVNAGIVKIILHATLQPYRLYYCRPGAEYRVKLRD